MYLKKYLPECDALSGLYKSGFLGDPYSGPEVSEFFSCKEKCKNLIC